MKKKSVQKKALISLTFLILLSGCSYQDEIKLKGMWLGTYTINNDSILSIPSVKPLISINQKNLSYRTVGYLDGVFDRTDSLSTDYVLKKKNILYLNKIEKSISIEFYTKDSISGYYTDEPYHKWVFNKIKEEITSPIWNLKDNEYQYVGNNNKLSSIYFANDSVCIEYNKEKETFRLKEWELVEFKKQKFLVINNFITSLTLHVDSISTNATYLSEYSGAKSYAFEKMSEMKSTQNSLDGEWHFDKILEPTSASSFPKIKSSMAQEIKFKNGSIEYLKDSKLRNEEFLLIGFENLIVFPSHFNKSSSIWKINKITTDILILEIYDDYGDLIERIKYLKK